MPVGAQTAVWHPEKEKTGKLIPTYGFTGGNWPENSAQKSRIMGTSANCENSVVFVTATLLHKIRWRLVTQYPNFVTDNCFLKIQVTGKYIYVDFDIVNAL
jgi:hypothetical protein